VEQVNVTTRQEVDIAAVPILELEGLEHHLRDEERPEEYVVHVRERITIMPGDFVALLGPSGCGKTTLLTVLGLLRRPTDPEGLGCFSIGVKEDGQVQTLDLKEAWCRNRQHVIERARRQHMGFALQSGELLPALTVRENVAVPLQVNGVGAAECRERVDSLIDAFQLRRSIERVATEDSDETYDLSQARVNKLSGGEYQRVSLARAIAHRPRLVFVDEPTASLNREMARGALQQFRSLQQDAADPGATIMITHDEVLASDFANVTIRMAAIRNQPAGEVVEIIRHDAPGLHDADSTEHRGERQAAS
jgi:ABC-type lipoprotein export system ATPase subunit